MQHCRCRRVRRHGRTLPLRKGSVDDASMRARECDFMCVKEAGTSDDGTRSAFFVTWPIPNFRMRTATHSMPRPSTHLSGTTSVSPSRAMYRLRSEMNIVPLKDSDVCAASQSVYDTISGQR
jgi:hypothetical protein